MKELSFSFEVESNLTLFDDRVSALFDGDEKEKIIAKKDMLRRSHGTTPAGEISRTEELDAYYTLVDKWLDLDQTIVEIILSVHELDKLGLIQLSHLGYVSITGKNTITINMVSEGGEFEGAITHNYDLEGLMIIRVFMPYSTRMVVMLGDKELFLDLPEGLAKGVKIQGFLGRMSGTDARVYGIRTYDISALDGLVASSTRRASTEESIKGEIVATEEEKKEIELASSKKLKMAWTKEVQEDLVSIQEGSPQDLALKKVIGEAAETWTQEMNDELEKYIQAGKNIRQTSTNMHETILQIISRFTGLQEEVILNMPRNELLRLVYNGIMSHSEYDSMSHFELLKETHYLCSQLLQDEVVTVVPKIGLGGKTYRTYEFGEVGDSNCGMDKLLYLVKTYPDVWLKRLV